MCPCVLVSLCPLREGNEPGDELTVTYTELLQSVCRFANVLKSQGRWPPPHRLWADEPTHRDLTDFLVYWCLIHVEWRKVTDSLSVCRREEGRPCVHLHAHGGGAGGGHVGLCPHRSRSLHRGAFPVSTRPPCEQRVDRGVNSVVLCPVRRFLCWVSVWEDHGLAVFTAHHCRSVEDNSSTGRQGPVRPTRRSHRTHPGPAGSDLGSFSLLMSSCVNNILYLTLYNIY